MAGSETMVSSDREETVRHAERLLAIGDVSSAITKYEELAFQGPADPLILNRLGDLYARAGRPDDAVDLFIEVAQDWATGGFPSRAIAIYKKVIKIDPTRLDVYESLASLYGAQGLVREATVQLSVLRDYYAKHGSLSEVARIQRQLDKLFPSERVEAESAESSTAQLPIEGVPPVRTKMDLVVFLCHASEDKSAVRKLYSRLSDDLLQPWLDEEDLLPGQRWELEIQRAVRKSHVVLVCLSNRAVKKSGFVHREIRFALDVLEEQPEGIIFVVPVRLEECPVPQSLSSLHYVDLYSPGGYEKLLRAIHERARQLGFTSVDVS